MPLAMEGAAYRNKALDGLRGIAASSVIFYHAILHNDFLINSVLIPPFQEMNSVGDIATKVVLALVNGNSAVLLFFVLSGFVLRLSLEREQDRPAVIIVYDFVVRRICRLYPAMFFCMAVYLAVAIIYSRLGWVGFPAPSISAPMLNAFLIQITWHGPSGTIQAEFLAVPFILLAFFATRVFGTAGLLACFTYSIFAFENPALILWAPNMSGWLFAFLIGMVVADKRVQPFLTGITGAGLALLFVGYFGLRAFSNMGTVSSAIAQGLLCGAIVGTVYYASPKLALVRLLNSRPVLFLGRISYSLYLLNVIWLLVAWSAIPKQVYQSYALAVGLAVGITVLLATLPFAALSERIFEQGGIWLGQRLSSKARYPSGGTRSAAAAAE